MIRHGRVAQPWPERIYGDLDVPLSEEGRAGSRRAAERLAREPLALVVSSGLERADYLARELVARSAADGAAPPLVREPRLREIHRGEWSGLGEDELEARHPGAWRRFWERGGAQPPPGGETLEELARRVSAALEELGARHPGASVAIAAHRWVLRAAACSLLGLSLERAVRLDIPPCGLLVLDWPGPGEAPSVGRLVVPGGA